jgi:type IV pilus assembly protein PilV
MPKRTPVPASQRGVVLIEVLVAALIFAIGILAVIGLQAAAIANVADAKYRVDASEVANQVLGSLWAGQGGLAAGSPPCSASALPSGACTLILTAITDPLNVSATPVGYAANVTITWQPPNGAAHTFNAVSSVYPH